MHKPERIKTILIYVVFAFYVLFLCKLLFLSRLSLADMMNGQRLIERSINLIPFASIKEYLFTDSFTIQRFAFSNVVGNIAIFVPLGTYLTLFRKDKRIASNLLWIFIASLLVETIHGLFGIGAADIDDILLNCLGGFIGILGYKLLLLILRDEKRVRTAIAIISLMGLPVLLYYLFMIRLRL